MIAPGKENEVISIIHDNTPLIDGAESQEVFQRKYGLDLKHKKYENDIYVLEFEPFKTSQENEA